MRGGAAAFRGATTLAELKRTPQELAAFPYRNAFPAGCFLMTGTGIAPRADLPADTRLWAALQAASGGTWAGCVYDPDAIIAALRSGGVTASASAGTSSAA